MTWDAADLFRKSGELYALQGRMNATRRSINRGIIVVGAPLGGLLADTIGYRPALWLAIAGFALAAGFPGGLAVPARAA